MAQLRVCVKCTKPVIKNQPAFKQEDGSVIHGACYNCDQCGANMGGKKVGSQQPDCNDFDLDAHVGSYCSFAQRADSTCRSTRPCGSTAAWTSRGGAGCTRRS